MHVADAPVACQSHDIATVLNFGLHLQEFVHARVHALPYYLDPAGPSVNPVASSVGTAHTGRLLTLSGTVMRAHGIQLFEAYRYMECCACKMLVCGQVSVVDPTVLDLPECCPAQGCKGESFQKREDAAPGYTNYQEIGLQVCCHVG